MKYAIIIFLFLGSSNILAEETMPLSLKKAVNLASQKVATMGYDVKKMEVIADVNNKKWKSFYQMYKRIAPSVIKNISGNDYFAIYFQPKELTFGGDLWIFVDKSSGEILEVIVGK